MTPPPFDGMTVRDGLYSLLVISTCSSKVVHLLPYINSVAPLSFLVHSPAIFARDLAILAFGRFFFRVSPGSRCQNVSASVGALGAYVDHQCRLIKRDPANLSFPSIITWLAASLQIAFYLETRGELAWETVGVFLRDGGGVELLLSGALPTAVCGLGLIIASVITCSPLRRSSAALAHSAKSTLGGQQVGRPGKHDAISASVYGRYSSGFICIPLASMFLFQILQPQVQPYADMSTTLLFSLFQARHSSADEYCSGGHIESTRPFPYLTSAAGTLAGGEHGWTWSKSGDPPTWLSHDEQVPGFEFLTSASASYQHIYLPESDPLKISNLDIDILRPLQHSLGSASHKIKHIVLFSLESTRADVFPLSTESHLYKSILATHANLPAGNTSDLDQLLSNISPVAELLTGTAASSGFSDVRPDTAASPKPGTWRARLAAQPSGINIRGAVTGSTMTMKSLLGSHCGVHPLAVAYTAEAELSSYQACLAHILDLFNRNKSHASESEAPHDAQWTSAYVQTSTDKFDRQAQFNAMIGFAPENTFTKSNLTDPQSRYFPATEPVCNYFSYPESQAMPYLRDLFAQTQSQGKRLFLSYLTSQTHHPFTIPKAFGDEEMYLGKDNWKSHKPLNSYLNSIRYADHWLGEVMDLLDEAGMTNETLIVLVGDQ
ncbi:hypothetical protein ANO11243_034950 [Dothideomycetidae sp. 11243]|nr:hypothetical protein ANO11243_034950 [fungal sp. No.11243]